MVDSSKHPVERQIEEVNSFMSYIKYAHLLLLLFPFEINSTVMQHLD